MAKSVYRKLSGRRRSFLGYSQLWLGPDHLLLVKSTRIAEQYQRFALSDIQSIVITLLPDRTLLQIAGAAAAIAWSLGYVLFDFWFAKYFFAVTGALAFAAVVIDVLRGPRCICHLTTAVSRELLRPVARLQTAERFMAMVEPAIEAAQGALGPPPEVAPDQPATAIPAPPAVPASRSFLPEIVFGLFLLDAALILLKLRFPRAQIESILPTTFFAEIVLVTVALIQGGRRDRQRAIYALLMLAIVGLGWDGFEVGDRFVTFFRVMMATGQSDVAAYFSNVSWHRDGLVAAAWRIAAGTAGLALSFLGRESK